MSSIDYVADHIDRIERRHAGDESLILNSKWRIASNLNLFAGELKKDGTLSPEQIAQIDSYIAKFKSTPGGREAIAFFAGKKREV